jgi:hypothetical protein
MRRAARFVTAALAREERDHGGLSEAARGGRAFDYIVKAALLRHRSRQRLAAGPDTPRTKWFAELESRVYLPPEIGGDGRRRLRWLDLCLRLPGDCRGLGIETKCFSGEKRPGERVGRIERDVEKLSACVALGAIDAGLSLVVGTGFRSEAFQDLVARGASRGGWIAFDEVQSRGQHPIFLAYVGVMARRSIDGP